jgi:hypothetical protein
MTLPGSLKGEPEEAERLKIKVLAEIAAQLAELNSSLLVLQQQSSDQLAKLFEACTNFAVGELRDRLEGIAAALRPLRSLSEK